MTAVANLEQMAPADPGKPTTRGALDYALSRQDAAQFLAISLDTLHKMEHRGEIRFVRYSGCTRVPASEVRRLLGQTD